MRLVSLCAVASVCALVPVCPPALGATQTSAAASARSAALAQRPVAVIPFHRNGKLIALDVRVGASRTFSFVLDSGAHRSVIDTAVARELRIRTVGSGSTTGTGRGAVAVTRLASVRLALRGATLDVAEPLAIDLHAVPADAPLDGLVGFELFRRYVVRLDVGRGLMSLYEPASYRGARAAAVVPLHVRGTRIFLPAMLTAGDGTRARRDLRVDTGSEESVADALAARSAVRRSTVLGQGLGANYAGTSGVFARVQIGPFVWSDVWGPSAQPTIGMELLRRFTLTFDVGRGKLELVPNAHLHDPVPSPQPSS